MNIKWIGQIHVVVEGQLNVTKTIAKLSCPYYGKSAQETLYILYNITDLPMRIFLLLCPLSVCDTCEANTPANAHVSLETLLLWHGWADRIHPLFSFHPVTGILVGHLRDIL